MRNEVGKHKIIYTGEEKKWKQSRTKRRNVFWDTAIDLKEFLSLEPFSISTIDVYAPTVQIKENEKSYCTLDNA